MPKIEPNGLPPGPPSVVVECPSQNPMNTNAGGVGVVVGGVIASGGPGAGNNNNNGQVVVAGVGGGGGVGQDMPQKKFPCHLCRRSFMHKQSLDIHMRSHTGEETLFIYYHYEIAYGTEFIWKEIHAEFLSLATCLSL